VRQARYVSAVTLAVMASACGQHLGVDLDAVRASRQADDHIAVEADVSVNVTGPARYAADVKEVCAEATWTTETGNEVLFSARNCTTEPWTDREKKVLRMSSAEPVPVSPAKLITVKLTVSASEENLMLVVRDYMDNQIASP
jgi:hypothetical protein